MLSPGLPLAHLAALVAFPYLTLTFQASEAP
jgi:hypothetical protein